MAKMRIDLDGVPLDDEDGRTTALFRFRTTRGLQLALPESVDVLVPWSDIAAASLDLVSGRIVVELVPDAPKRHPWLGRARTLAGTWTDRTLLTEAPR